MTKEDLLLGNLKQFGVTRVMGTIEEDGKHKFEFELGNRGFFIFRMSSDEYDNNPQPALTRLEDTLKILMETED